ncbi:hypothetical protein [Trinickia soli]|uniref:hypothetical protein n=1 Tax=Trinickia soli TaxID=380675 RepID=UPI0012B890F9
MTSSTHLFPSRRILAGIAALLALSLFAGCTTAASGLPSASTSAHGLYGADGHYGGWGTGFGSDGSRGRG